MLKKFTSVRVSRLKRDVSKTSKFFNTIRLWRITRSDNIPKPFRFSGVLAKVIFFFKKAKSSTIAFVTVLFFNAFKGRKNESKNRKAVWFGYNTNNDLSKAL